MDDRSRELIHGDIDGELDAAEREELRRIIATSDEARLEHEGLELLRDTLAGLPDFEPPAGLRAAIVAQAWGRPSVSARSSAQRPPRGRTGLRLVAAFVAAAVLVAVLVNKDAYLHDLDPSALSGTIGRQAPDAAAPVMRFEGYPAAGTISVYQGDQGPVLEVELDAGRPVTVIARAGNRPLEVEALVPITGMAPDTRSIDGDLGMVHHGKHHYLLILKQRGAADTAIDVAVYDGEHLVQQGSLKLQAPGIGSDY